MNLIEYIKKSVWDFGKHGSNSLEYIGAVIRNNDCIVKVYQTPTREVFEYAKEHGVYKNILNNLLCSFISQDKIKICDISESLYNNVPTYRMVFSLPKKFDIDLTEKYVESFFETLNYDRIKKKILVETFQIYKILGFDYCPLMQLGIECDRNASVMGIKYYINLKAKRYSKTRIAENLIDDILQIFSIDIKDKDFLWNRLMTICQYNYAPIFIGVNDYEDISDIKIYFQSNTIGVNTGILYENTRGLIRELGLDNIFSDGTLKELHSMDLFIDGIAYTLNKKDEWRLYFNSIPGRSV